MAFCRADCPRALFLALTRTEGGSTLQELVEILREDAESLEREFRKASTLGKGTPQEVSEFRENAFRSFISRFFPAPYRAVKGKIFDSYGNGPSASVDCVVVNPVHPHLIDTAGKFQLLLAERGRSCNRGQTNPRRQQRIDPGSATGRECQKTSANQRPHVATARKT